MTSHDHQDAPAIEVRALSKIFRDFWRRPRVQALRGLDLDVRRGEVFGLLGPNGSGKSTAIKLLLGLLHPSAGTVRVLGRRPDDVAVKARIGYLPEESNLYRHLTARETLDFYGRLFDLPAGARHERTARLLARVGLGAAADRPVGEFSKGMLRRIGLAQALMNEPELLILDEPTAGLDPLGCREVKDLLLELAAQGRTVLLSSHLLADVEDVCARVAILDHGQVRAAGRLDELLRRRDRVRLTLPVLPPATLDKLVHAIREIGGSTPEIDHPSLNLEALFLRTVARARQEQDTPPAERRT